MFNVGDEVTIKYGLSNEGLKVRLDESGHMKSYEGRSAKVIRAEKGNIRLNVDNGRWNWDKNTLELIPDKEY